MEKCPKCRTKYDPSYTVSCSNCGALLVPSIGAGAPSGFESEPDAVDPTVSPQRARVRRGIPRRWIITGLLVLSGLVMTFFTDARRGEGGEIVGGGLIEVTEAQVGDCVSILEPDLDADVITDLEGVPCSEPHHMEVYALTTHDGAEFPGREALEEFATEECIARFDDYVGAPYETEPLLDFTYLIPEPDGWANGDRGVTCALVTIGGADLVGSRKGQGLIHFQALTGGCYDLPEHTEDLYGLHPRACDDFHDVEVYASLTEPSGSDVPFDAAALVDFGDRMCLAGYEQQFGAGATDPDVTWSYFYPTSESWVDGDRSFTCFISRIDQGQLTGSYQQGSA